VALQAHIRMDQPMEVGTFVRTTEREHAHKHGACICTQGMQHMVHRESPESYTPRAYACRRTAPVGDALDGVSLRRIHQTNQNRPSN
jgi:hypothetical protein